MLLEIRVFISHSYSLLGGFKQKAPTVKISKRINSEELERMQAVWAKWVQSFTPGKQGRDQSKILYLVTC